MTPQSRHRRIGWFAALAICTALYLLLHLKVHSVMSEVVRAERRIVQLESANLLLETEFLTRSSHVQLAAWNRVEFGYSAPKAEQFIESERQLAQFGQPRSVTAPEPIRLARFDEGEAPPPFQQLVSPLTGKPVDSELIEPEERETGHLAIGLAQAPLRIPINPVAAMGDDR